MTFDEWWTAAGALQVPSRDHIDSLGDFFVEGMFEDIARAAFDAGVMSAQDKAADSMIKLLDILDADNSDY